MAPATPPERDVALLLVDQPIVPSVAVAVKTAPTTVGVPLVSFKLATVAPVALKVPLVTTLVTDVLPN
jgi:hypothetical protein